MTGISSPEDLARAVQAQGVTDARLLEAVRRTPREEFVPTARAGAAYIDEPVPISHEQTTSQPSLSARMIEALRLGSGDRALEIGTGSGFATALLARLAAEVVTIDRWQDMIQTARSNLDAQGIENVTMLTGDGSRGAPEHGPFDAIMVTAAYPEVPQTLIDQLHIGGRLVQPIGSGGHDKIIAFERTTDGLERREFLMLARFVRLHGQHGYPDSPA